MYYAYYYCTTTITATVLLSEGQKRNSCTYEAYMMMLPLTMLINYTYYITCCLSQSIEGLFYLTFAHIFVFLQTRTMQTQSVPQTLLQFWQFQ